MIIKARNKNTYQEVLGFLKKNKFSKDSITQIRDASGKELKSLRKDAKIKAGK